MRKFIHYDYLRRAFLFLPHQAHKIPFLYTVFLSKELFLNQQLLLPSLFFHAFQLNQLQYQFHLFHFPCIKEHFITFPTPGLLLHITLTFRDFADEYILNIPRRSPLKLRFIIICIQNKHYLSFETTLPQSVRLR